jgi:hypothetical protein
MSADLSPDHSLHSRLHAWMERGFSKLLFVRRYVRGDRRAAADVGVRLSASDYLRFHLVRLCLDDGSKCETRNAAGGRCDQNAADYLQTASQNAPPARVTPPCEIASRLWCAEYIEETCAKESGNEQPNPAL